MSENKGKNFRCGKCNSTFYPLAETTVVVCPTCKTKNSLPGYKEPVASIIGKTFLCYNCKAEFRAGAEGDYFVCSKCQARNTIPQVPLGEILVAAIPVAPPNATLNSINTIKLLVAVALIIYSIYLLANLT